MRARSQLTVLDAGYDEATVEAYGAMAALPPRQRLEQLERWRTRHGDKPKLLEMLGRVCASEQLWGKAEAYLLGSLAAGDTVSARVALAQLYESIDRPRDASLQFQLAARLALGERPPLPSAASPAGAASAEALGTPKTAKAEVSAGQAITSSASAERAGPGRLQRPTGAIAHAGDSTATVSSTTPPSESDATPPVDFKAGTGDERGLVGRKE